MTRTFEFLDMPERTSKPRSRGITSVADIGVPNSYVEGTLELWHDAIDAVKVSAFVLTADDAAVRAKIQLYRKWDIDAQIGGPVLELARLQGKERQTLERMRDMGYTSLEISAEALPEQRPMEDERTFADLARSYGFMLHGEVGKKFPDGDRLRRSATELDIDAAVDEIQGYLDIGCDWVYFEGHLLRAIVGDNAEFVDERGWQIVEMASRVGVDRIVFEVPFTYLSYASKRILQHWLVQQFGPNVNVANVLLSEIPELEVIRSGMFPVFGANGGDHPYLAAAAVSADGNASGEWWRNRQ